MLNKKLFKISSLIFILVFLPFVTQATCPVCTIAIASGLGLCRYIGIDDVISGLWVGGLILSFTFSFVTWLSKRKKNFKYSSFILLIVNYLLVFIPLQLTGVIGHKLNKIVGIDRLFFGSICGTFLIIFSSLVSDWLKKYNNNKVYFPYQKVVIPVVVLIIFSFVFYFTLC